MSAQALKPLVETPRRYNLAKPNNQYKTTPEPLREVGSLVPFIDIRNGQCRAIILNRDDGFRDALCCGKSTEDITDTYCVCHASVYYNRK